MNGINCGDKRGSVTNASLLERLDRFATLATRLDFIDVTPNPLRCHVCHVCHKNKQDTLVSNSVSQVFIGKSSCFQWLKIVMDEGHLEPSQPYVGKTLGWPERRISIKSLWIDFCSWFQKQHRIDEIPEEYCFYELLDHLFIRHDDKYEFPPLDQCQRTFAKMRQQYECD